MGLANITDVETIFEPPLFRGKSFVAEKVFCFTAKPPQSELRFVKRAHGISHREHDRTGKNSHYIGSEDSESGKASREYGQKHTAHFKSSSQIASVQSTSSSKCYERVVPRIVAAFDGNSSHGPLNDGIRNAENSLRESFYGSETSLALLKLAASFPELQSKPTIQQAAATEVAKHSMRVGYRR